MRWFTILSLSFCFISNQATMAQEQELIFDRVNFERGQEMLKIVRD